MDFFDYLLKVFISLIIVLLLIFIVLPTVVPFLQRVRWGKGFYDGENVKVKKVIPLAKNIFIAEIYVKDKLIVVCFTEKGADIIYREDDRVGSGNTAD